MKDLGSKDLTVLARRALEETLQYLKTAKDENKKLKNELEIVNEENQRLREALEKAGLGDRNSPPDDRVVLNDLKSELVILRQKYDQLASDKAEVVEQYQTHLRKWQSFKKQYSRNLLQSTAHTSVKMEDAIDRGLPPSPGPSSQQGHVTSSSEAQIPLRISSPGSAFDPMRKRGVNDAQQFISPPKKKRRRTCSMSEGGSHRPLSSIASSSTSDHQRCQNVVAGTLAFAKQTDAPDSHSVRRQIVRKQLVAEDCECCHNYYEQIGTVIGNTHRPSWRTPQKQKPVASKHTPMATTVSSRKQDISRHRVQQKGPRTPPQYWTIGFPSTQDAMLINQEAEKLCSNRHL